MTSANSNVTNMLTNDRTAQLTVRRSLLCMFVLQVLLWMPALEVHAANRNLKGSSRVEQSRRSVRMIGHQRMFNGKGGKRSKREGGVYGVGAGDPQGATDSFGAGNDGIGEMVGWQEDASNGDEGPSASSNGLGQGVSGGVEDPYGGGDGDLPSASSGETTSENVSENASENSAGSAANGDIGAGNQSVDNASENIEESPSTGGDNEGDDEGTNDSSEAGNGSPSWQAGNDGNEQGAGNASGNSVESAAANGETIIEGQGANTSAANSVIAASAVQCNGVDYNHIFDTWWKYSLETESDFPKEIARVNLEEALLKEITKREWQGCTRMGGSRRLTENPIDVVAVDRAPDDSFSDDETCAEERDNCFILTGRMSTYVKESKLDYKAQWATVDRELRTLVRDWMNGGNVKAEGVVRATYLGPNWDDPSSLESSLPTKVSGDRNTLTPGISVLVALGAFSVVLFCITYAYRWRRDDKLANATIVTGSEITTSGSNLSASTTGVVTSPFSGMLPNAYRLDREMNMSAILEGDSDSASQGVRSDIIISESGFTTDDECSVSQNLTDPESLTHAYLQSLSKTPVLGAQPMYDEEDEDDLLFDTGSGEESEKVQ